MGTLLSLLMRWLSASREGGESEDVDLDEEDEDEDEEEEEL